MQAVTAVVVQFNGAALRSLAVQASEADLKVRANRVLNAARRAAPVDTGRLRASIAVSFTKSAQGPVARIGSNLPYAVFIHEGTGVYGPRGTPIRPTRARFLSWQPRGGQRVYAREVRGVRPRPFLADALEAAR